MTAALMAYESLLCTELEFKYVFIAAVNNRIIPLPFAINKTDSVSEAEVNNFNYQVATMVVTI